ncbi:sensor histidine kinase [Saccharopolyspora sp. K220]|uniref:sensor histidine kinase n=1 Tax=Saccharopolyspora soli TaxID=2926618 RepID=UPI001F581390|nr:sensor histidine kinase [Saccharopolyspora soli]MCI2420483.1 sensor histidine kinase [Saccharopolyspora soli]
MPSADDRNWFGRVRPRWSLARQLFVLQVVVVALVVLAGAGLAWYDAQQRNEDGARDKVVAVARTLAAQPAVREGVTAPNPSATLQPLAERVRLDTGVDFITIMSPDGIRYTHPDPTRIGQVFLGHIDQAVAGHVFTETYTGTLGPSVRAVVPVYDDAYQLRGLVAVGITVRILTAELREQVTALALVAAGALLVGGVLTYLVSERIRRHTHGLRPAELSRMYEYHDAILHAVREGLLLVAPSGLVTLCNDGAAVLLSMDPGEAEGKDISELGLPQSLVDTLGSGRTVRDEVHLTDDRVLLVNISQIHSGGRDLGAVVTLRDHTELQALSGELDSMRGFAESLRSQAHESANRLHTVVSLVELGRAEEAVAFATAELELAQQLTDRVVGAVSEPVLAAVLLGKSAEAGERGVEVVLSPDTEIDDAAVGHLDSRDLVTILGNLIDNAVEAALESPQPRVEVTIRSTSDGVLIRVADNGPGVDPDSAQQVFQRGWSTKDDGRGLGLALVGQSVRRHRGTIVVHNEGGAVFTVQLPAGSDVAR